jgi:hypothetical protein
VRHAGGVTRTSPTSTPARRRGVPGWRNLPRWARWPLLALVLVLLGVLAIGAWLGWVLSGGWDGLRPKAQPDDRAVVAARAQAAAPLDDLTATVLAAMDRLSDTGLVEAARIRTDECHEGQNNWKVHSGFTLRCEIADVLALRLDTDIPGSAGAAPTSQRLAPLETAARSMDAELRDEGWTEAYTGSGLHVSRSGSARLTGHYVRPSSSSPGAAGFRAGSFGLEVGLYLGPPPDYELPQPAGTTLLETRRVDGDLSRFRQAVTSGTSPRLVAHVSLAYFTD